MHLMQPAVVACENAKDPFACVKRHSGATLVGMATGDVGQLAFQLQSYLQQKTVN